MRWLFIFGLAFTNIVDVSAIASDIRAGNSISLQADNRINLQAARSSLTEQSDNQSSGASIGIGFALGGQQNGFTLELAANKARGNANGTDSTATNTHLQAGNIARLQSGGDTTLQGAVVKANTVQADIGGNLKIESLQDSSQFDSKQTSAGIGISLCIPPFCYGASSASGSFSKSNVNGDYLGVVEQSGIKAGDGGFTVKVKGDTTLTGAVIASTQGTIDQHKNSLSTASLTQTDLQNKDTFDADGFGISATVSGKLGDQGSATTTKDHAAAGDVTSRPSATAGVGSSQGNQTSTTRSGISDGAITITDDARQQALTGQDAASTIASLTPGITTDSNTAGTLVKAWNGPKLQQEIQAQVAITQAFSQLAPKAVASYAGSQAAALRKQGNEEEARKWDEGGVYRVALHTVAGALGGGLPGAAGAAAVSGFAPLLNELQASTEAALIKQGMSEGAAKMIAQGLAQATSLGIGAAAGGTQGAATALAVDTNNRQLHPGDFAVAKTLAAKSGGQYTEAQILSALRYAGLKDGNGNVIVAEGTQETYIGNAGNLTNVKTGASIQDTYKVDSSIVLRPDVNYPTTLIEDKPTQPNDALMAYIKTGTGGAASPYILNSSGNVAAPSLPPAPDGVRRINVTVDGVVYHPLVGNCPAASCTNGDPIAFGIADSGTNAYLEAQAKSEERKRQIAAAALVVGGAVVRAVDMVAETVATASAAARASGAALPAGAGGINFSARPQGMTYEGAIYRYENPSRVDTTWDAHLGNVAADHRYSGPGYGATYGGTSVETALAEVNHYGVAAGRVEVSRSIKIDNVLDLTNLKIREQLGISLEQLSGDSYMVTQQIGNWARQNGYGGILAPSARNPSGSNIVIFPKETP